MTEMHAVTRDQKEWGRQSPAAWTTCATPSDGAGGGRWSWRANTPRLHFGRGKLTLQEYVQYAVYDVRRLSPGEQERFVTNNLHWPITRA
jgi:hypothetical protein